MWIINCKKAGYENKLILQDFILKFNKSEKVALIGKNGVGKSTFVQLLLGILPVCECTISYDGLEIESYEQLRNIIGIVFQFPDDQFLGATVLEELRITAANFGKSKDEVDRLIHLFKLKPLLMCSPLELSGGQKQVIAFAITLLSEPKLLILDEATSMLDPISKRAFLEQVFAFQKQEQIAVIHITHDFRELPFFSQIAYLSNGVIEFSGSYQDFIDQLELFPEITLPLDLQIAYQLYKQEKISKMPLKKEDWEEVAWVLKSLI